MRRDAWGVPYIEAASLDDLWFAHGVVTAGERLFQLELTLRAANGRLSELFGERTLDEDRLARTVGFHRAGARIAATWDERSTAMHARFRAGVRAWVDAMPAAPLEYTLLDTTPWVPDDEAVWASAFVLLAWGLSGNWDTELLRSWIGDAGGDDAVGRLLPPLPADPPEVVPGALAGALFDAAPRAKGQGSNAWVVAGSRTSTGAPLLANDPHLLAMQPGIWMECHLSAPGYRARGVSLPFSPGVLLGCTASPRLGGHERQRRRAGSVHRASEPRAHGRGTRRGVGTPDRASGGDRRARRGAPGPARGLGRRATGRCSTRSSPDRCDPSTCRCPTNRAMPSRGSASSTASGPRSCSTSRRPRSFEAFRAAALEGLACPGQNVVYADVDGTIGYACTGRYPVRSKGDGTVPAPGWTRRVRVERPGAAR